MRHEIYRALDVIVLLLLALGACVLQSTVLPRSPLAWLQLDLLLLFVSHLGLRRAAFEGGALTIVIARMAEIHSGAPAGLMIVSYLAVYLFTLFTREFFLMGTSFSTVVIAMLGGLVWKITFLLIAGILGLFSNVWRPTLEFLVPALISLGVLSGPAFRVLRALDMLFAQDTDPMARNLGGEGT